MEPTLEILKYTIPALLVLLAAYSIIRSMLKRDQDIRRTEIIMGNQKIITPLRLQAYERAVMFLERISPESLIMRVRSSNMTARQLQTALLSTIRQEYEHNLSQQIYMSPEAWESLRNSKESIVQLINVAASRVKAEDSAIKLSTHIIEMHKKAEESPIENGINFIKREINNFMNTRNNFY